MAANCYPVKKKVLDCTITSSCWINNWIHHHIVQAGLCWCFVICTEGIPVLSSKCLSLTSLWRLESQASFFWCGNWSFVEIQWFLQSQGVWEDLSCTQNSGFQLPSYYSSTFPFLAGSTTVRACFVEMTVSALIT
jgi:hypothetical protein